MWAMDTAPFGWESAIMFVPASSGLPHQVKDFSQTGFDFGQAALIDSGRRGTAGFLPMPSRALDGEFFFMKQVFNGQDLLHIPAAIEALAGIGALGPYLGKLGLPESEYIGRYTGQGADLLDAEVEFVWQFSRVTRFFGHGIGC